MTQDFDFSLMNADNTVYVRPILVADLPDEVQEQVNEYGGGEAQIYSVHNAAGERLALVKDRKLAFLLARQNDMAPVSVH